MSTDEQRGYSRGYAAGRKRRKNEQAAERWRAERQAFLERAFLAVLPACMDAQDWTRGGKPIISLDDRTRLAWDFAEAALKQRRHTS